MPHTYPLECIKPYLRPLDSMTEEESEYIQTQIDIATSAWEAMSDFINFCYKRHLDFHHLILKGLALEAPEGMYEIK